MFTRINISGNQSNFDNVLILNRVRFIAIVSQIVLLLFAKYYLQIQLPLILLSSFIGAEIIFQIFAIWRTNNSLLISTQEIIIYIVFDSLILALLVYFSGGPNNPFIYLLLLPIALATLMLTAKGLILVVSIQLVLYSLLNIYQIPLSFGTTSPLEFLHLHLFGMWVNFVITVIMIALFGWLTRQSMMKHEKEVQSFREKQLQDEQLLALGIMSASAAHELGTPLSTIAIIVDDFQHKDFSDEVKKDLILLTSQIACCRRIIKSLGSKSLAAQESLQNNTQTKTLYNAKQIVNVKKCLQKVIDNWLIYRPDVNFKQVWHEETHQLNIHLTISVEQAITNLLDNAADASISNQKDNVSMLCYIEPGKLIIEIKDYGKGVSSQIMQSSSRGLQETMKKDGLGWGLFLSNASIERIGGSIELLQGDHDGTLTRISLLMEN